MNALLNGEILGPQEAENMQNRGFRFGDGCFETMLVLGGRCPLLAQHEARIARSLQVLGLQRPVKLELATQIKEVCKDTEGWQRVRLWLWRTGEGTYAPQSDKTQFMLAAAPTQPPGIHIKQQAKLSKEVVLSPARWSFVKSISALPYVMAGREKESLKADELILLNYRGEVAEATMANLFWKKRKRWYTPALDTGCVAGVMRAWLKTKLLEKGEPVLEIEAHSNELQNVDKLVCTNVAGLYPIAQLENRQYNTDVEELWELMPQEY